MSAGSGRVRVLVVEDAPLNLELVVDLLEAAGFSVSTAGTAELGLEQARANDSSRGVSRMRRASASAVESPPGRSTWVSSGCAPWSSPALAASARLSRVPSSPLVPSRSAPAPPPCPRPGAQRCPDRGDNESV